MTFTIDTTTLPENPRRAYLKGPTEIKSITMPGALPILISMGNKAEVLTIQGYIGEAGKTKAQLETDYINPLKAKKHLEVTIAADDTRYDGDWVMADCDFWESMSESGIRAFLYKMEFWRGSSHIILT